jgi:hypothetical protein
MFKADILALPRRMDFELEQDPTIRWMKLL